MHRLLHRNPAPEGHPRPQLRRPWIDLRGTWRFAFDDDDVGERDGWPARTEVFDREIVVPFPPESRASRVGETGYHPVVWYRLEIALPSARRGARTTITFGAVDYAARVWVNGQLAGGHEGGHTPFTLDITACLRPEPEQVIVVRAHDDPHDLAQPRGKQFWGPEPAIIWYHRTTGVWQPVWLESLGEAFVESLRWTPDPDRYAVRLAMRIGGRDKAASHARVRLSLRGQPLSEDVYAVDGPELEREIVLPRRSHRAHAARWATHHPNLIDAEIALLDAGGVVLDRVESYFGLRRIEAADGHLLLNGAPIFLRLVLAQNYWPQSHLAAPSDAAIRREVELAQALGFNGLRIHQKIEDPRFLYWCDRLGMMVWGEAANAYVFDPRAVDRLTREWAAAVQRDYNHPSIVAWVPLNESWGVPDLEHDPAQRAFVKALYHLTKALDRTRPVIANDGWQHAVGDIFGVHDYAMESDRFRERYGSPEALRRTFEALRPLHNRLLIDGHTFAEEPVVVSEFGGLSIKPQEDEAWFGYATTNGAEEMLALYEELVGALLESTALAGFCYTQLTDTEQETTGLLTANREPKLDVAAVCAINSRLARSIPGDVLDAIHQQEVADRRANRTRDAEA
jgi:hypothetical protein